MLKGFLFPESRLPPEFSGRRPSTPVCYVVDNFFATGPTLRPCKRIEKITMIYVIEIKIAMHILCNRQSQSHRYSST
ncbi:MAG: hypothetical protein SGI89_01105 [bacterium]|nr:hypothetical protein [bacterium]